jgi:hypothetical protein
MFVQRLRKVQQALLKQSVTPEICRFNMRYFGIQMSDFVLDAAKDQKPVCNTMACIAGEAILQQKLATIPRGGGFELTKEALRLYYSGTARAIYKEEIIAQKILGLTKVQAKKLFYFKSMDGTDGWPEYLEEAYKKAVSGTTRALIGAQRIELFIQSKGNL